VREVLLFPGALIDQLDFHAVVQKRQLAQPAREDVEVVFDHPKDLGAGQECTSVRAFLSCRSLERR